MARSPFELEIGLSITAENGELGQSVLRGTALPGSGDTFQDAAQPGSIYLRDNGEIYIKSAAGTGTDKWERITTVADQNAIIWRSEKMRAYTGDTLVAGLTDPTTWSDNESGIAAGDFTAGDYVGAGNDLWLVDSVSAPNITISLAPTQPASGFTYLTDAYLPDSPGSQENAAIITYTGSQFIKIADVDFGFTDGINVSPGYTPSAGNVLPGDVLTSALEKLDGNLDNTSSILGRDVQTDTDMGAYSGTILTDNQSAKTNIQELETAVEAINAPVGFSVDGITAETTVTSVLAADARTIKVFLEIFLASSPTTMRSYEVYAITDGTSEDNNVSSRLRLNASGFSPDIVVDVSGGALRVRVSNGSAVNVRGTRIDVAF